jgi:lipopolysaccharide export system permease protein
MTQVQNYLIKNQVHAFVTILSGLLVVFILGQSIQLIHEIQNDHLPLAWIGWGLCLELPFYLNLLIPLAYLLASVLTFNSLKENNEYTALQALGLSPKFTLKSVIIPAIPLFFLCTWITLSLSPNIYNFRETLLQQLQTQSIIQTIEPGEFVMLNHGSWVTYAKKKDKNESLQQIFVAMQQPEQPHSDLDVLTAARLRSMQPGLQDTLVFEDGQQIHHNDRDQSYQIVTFKKYQLQPKPIHLDSAHDDLENKSTLELLKQWDKPEVLATLQWRFLIPLSILLFAYCAWRINVQYTNQRNNNQHKNLLEATCLYCGFIALMLTAQGWLKTGITPLWLGCWWPLPIVMLVVQYRYKS